MKHRNWSWMAPLALAVALLPALVFGGQAVVPHVFVNGDTADANDVNSNFTALADAINDNDARIAELRGVSTIFVPAKGSASENGQALLNAIGTLGDKEIVLEFGFYDVGATTIDPQDFTSIRGVGRDRSVIESSAAPAVMGNGMLIRDLTIEHDPLEATDTILVSSQSSFDARNVELDVSSAFAHAAMRFVGCTCELFQVYVDLTTPSGSGADLVGIEVTKGSRTIMGNTFPVAARLTVRSCEILIHGAGAASWVGLLGGLPPSIVFVTETTIQSDGTAVYVDRAVCEVRNCSLSGSTAIERDAGTTRVACSMLSGAVVGNVTVVHCYDGSFNPLP